MFVCVSASCWRHDLAPPAGEFVVKAKNQQNSLTLSSTQGYFLHAKQINLSKIEENLQFCLKCFMK